MGIDAKEVVALAGYLAGKRLELFLSAARRSGSSALR